MTLLSSVVLLLLYLSVVFSENNLVGIIGAAFLQCV